MRIYSKRTLREFWERHSDAVGALDEWYRRARREDWVSPASVTALWSRASIVGRDRVVFRIKGNDYRLVVRVFYPGRQVFIRFIGTHAEYDRINAEAVRDHAARRGVLNTIRYHLGLALSENYRPHEVAEVISDAVLEAAPAPAPLRTEWTWRELADQFLVDAGKPLGGRFPTGFRYTDKALRGGLARADLAFLVADSGQGKTALAMQWAVQWAK